MNCPSCGANNPDGARWCGQCHQSFEQPSQVAKLPSAPAPPPSPAAQPYVEGVPPSAPVVAVTKSSSGFAIPAQYPSQAPAAAVDDGVTASAVTRQASGFAVPTTSAEPRGPVGPAHAQNAPSGGDVPLATPPTSPEPARSLPSAPPIPASSGSTQIPASPGPVGSTVQRGAQQGGVVTENKAGIIKDGTGRLLWQCSSCGGTNDIDALTCSVCGSSMFAEYIREIESAKKPAATPGQAAAWGAIPGGGQWAAGHKGDAIGRALLVLWLIACVVLLNDKSITWVRLIFAGAAIATWVISALDARIQAGARGIQILTVKRLLLVLVLSVALLLALSFVLAGKVRELDQKNPRGPAPQTQVPSPGDPGDGRNDQGGDGAPT